MLTFSGGFEYVHRARFEDAQRCARDFYITSVIRERMFIINVRNTVSTKVKLNEEGLPESTKQDTGHGYGLKNIRSIAHKYRGEIEIRQDESDGVFYFVLNVMLMG